MDVVIRSIMMYAILLLIFRLAGKRSLAQITTFDFLLLLIIGDVVQQAMVGNDYSLITGVLVVMTIVMLDVGLSLLKQRFPKIEPWLDGLPLVLVENGRPLKERLMKSRVKEEDILSMARELQGLEKMEEIKYAVLETDGHITIIPAQKG